MGKNSIENWRHVLPTEAQEEFKLLKDAVFSLSRLVTLHDRGGQVTHATLADLESSWAHARETVAKAKGMGANVDHAQDLYDDLYRQRGADEAFKIAADDARKLRQQVTDCLSTVEAVHHEIRVISDSDDPSEYTEDLKWCVPQLAKLLPEDRR